MRNIYFTGSNKEEQIGAVSINLKNNPSKDLDLIRKDFKYVYLCEKSKCKSYNKIISKI